MVLNIQDIQLIPVTISIYKYSRPRVTRFVIVVRTRMIG